MYEPLINITYFGKYPLEVGQLEDDSVRQKLLNMTYHLEPEFCYKLMGREMYEVVLTEAKGNQEWLTQPIIDLLYGKTFVADPSKSKCCNYKCTCTDGKVHYKGLIQNSDATNPSNVLNNYYNAFSPIANYVWWHYQESEATTTSGTGETKLTTINGSVASVGTKMVKAWNDMVNWINEFYIFIDNHIEDYPEFTMQCCDRWDVKKQNTFNFI